MKSASHKEIEKIMNEIMAASGGFGIRVQVPPESFLDMEGQFEEYEKNKRLVVSFPVKANQTNPIGMMQGGYIAAAFDNTFGPLSYLIAKRPCVTMDMSQQYIRSVETGQRVRVEAKVIAKGFSSIHMNAEMYSEKGKLLATANTNCLLLRIPGK